MGFNFGDCIACYCTYRSTNASVDAADICFQCFHELFTYSSDSVRNSLNRGKSFITNMQCYHCGEREAFLVSTDLCEDHLTNLKCVSSDEGDTTDSTD